MTIEEIKEIRSTVRPTEQEYFDAYSVEIVDTLLAEVERLEQVAPEKTAIRARLADNLTIATEALERIAGNLIDGHACDIIADCKDYTEALEMMAKVALERIGK